MGRVGGCRPQPQASPGLRMRTRRGTHTLPTLNTLLAPQTRQPDRGGAVSVARLSSILSFFELRVDLARLLEEMVGGGDGGWWGGWVGG